MNIHLLTLADKGIREAFRLFVQLPWNTSVFNSGLQRDIRSHADVMLASYAAFYAKIDWGFAADFHPVDQQASIRLLQQYKPEARTPPDVPADYILQPFHRYCIRPSGAEVYVGLVLWGGPAGDNSLIAYRCCIDTRKIDFRSGPFRYLDDLLRAYTGTETFDLHTALLSGGHSRRQFVRDCRRYYGTTLHAFSVRLRMLAAFRDIMFTTANFKEIAVANGFSGYNAMYAVFVRQYRIPLQQIPRLAAGV